MFMIINLIVIIIWIVITYRYFICSRNGLLSYWSFFAGNKRKRRSVNQEYKNPVINKQWKLVVLSMRCLNMVPSKQLITSACYSSWTCCNNKAQWSGLEKWRQSSINQDRLWGQKGPQTLLEHDLSEVDSMSSLAEMGGLVLSTPDPLQKSRLSHLAYSKWKQSGLPVGVSRPPVGPSRPTKPQLVFSLHPSLFDYLLVFSGLFVECNCFSLFRILLLVLCYDKCTCFLH